VESLVELLDECIKILDSYQVKTEQLYVILNRIKDNFSDDEEDQNQK